MYIFKKLNRLNLYAKQTKIKSLHFTDFFHIYIHKKKKKQKIKIQRKSSCLFVKKKTKYLTKKKTILTYEKYVFTYHHIYLFFIRTLKS